MADGMVKIKAFFDAKDANSGVNKLKASLNGLKSSGSSVGSVFKSVLGANLVSGALIGGFNALKNTVVGVGSAAVQEGAKLEQSFGGIDTLYSGAEAAAKSYAATAYKAGISANTYAEQAVSFGASLKQALGGDAVAAAKAADMAITDMADNAAKMGTDIGMVQQTYQSLARGNYAMLDNLKLGFGGTKSEMERLLKTAEELTGKKFDISNFADITEAIHAVQESLGIAGVAAEEARTTLSGSFGAMKAAWENTMGAITGKELDITPALEGLAQTASTFLFGNFIPMVGRVMQNLPKAIGTFIEKGRPALEEGLRKTFSEGAVKKIMGVFDGIVDFGSKIKAFFDNFGKTGAISAMADALESVGGAIGNIMSALSGKGDWSDFGTTLGEIAKTVSDVVSGIGDFVGKLDPGVIQGVAGAIFGVVGAFKALSGVASIVSGALSLISWVLSANPFTIAIVAIGALVGWFITAYNTSEDFRNKVDGALKAVGKAFDSVKKALEGIDPSILLGMLPVIATVGKALGGLAKTKIGDIFSSLFKKVKPAKWPWSEPPEVPEPKVPKGGASKITKFFQGIANVIKTIFNGIGTVISKAGTAISTAAKGIGTGLATAFRGLGQAVAMANPAQWLAFGAAMFMVGAGVALAAFGISMLVQSAIQLASAGSGAAIALVGMGVGIAALAGIFALLGPALTAGAVGIIAFGAAVALIGAGIFLATAGLSMLAGHLPIIAAFGASAAVGIAALGAGLVVMGVGAIVAGAGLMVAGAGLAVVGAGAVVAAVGAIALGVGLMVAGAGVAVFGAALNAAQPGIETFADAISKVIDSLSNGISSVLDSVAGIFDSIGNAALNAGRGFDMLANGVQKLNGVGIMRLGAIFAEVAGGLSSLAGNAAGLTAVGTGMMQLGQGFMMIQMSGAIVTTMLTQLSTTLPTLSASLTSVSPAITMLGASFTSLGPILTSVAMSFTTFTTSLMAAAMVFPMVGMQITALGMSMTILTTALAAAQGSLSAFTGSIGSVTGALSALSGMVAGVASSLMVINASSASASDALFALSAAFAMLAVSVAGSMTMAAASVIAGGAQMQTSITSTGQRMVVSMQSAMNQIVNAVRNGMNNSVSAVRSGGAQMVAAMRATGAQLVSAVQSMMNQAVSAVRSHHGAMVAAGNFIGQGLAQGMRQALPAVTAAANELVAQAERAARAKAKINSPSHLFRDEVGWWIGLGVAQGIENATPEIAQKMDFIEDMVNRFNVKISDVMDSSANSLTSRVQAETFKLNAKKEVISRQEGQSTYIADLLEIATEKLDDVITAVEAGGNVMIDSGALVGHIGPAVNGYIGRETRREGRRSLRP
ncbi:hypothetical protein ACXM1Q_000380 [Streptococcus sp. 10F2]